MTFTVSILMFNSQLKGNMRRNWQKKRPGKNRSAEVGSAKSIPAEPTRSNMPSAGLATISVTCQDPESETSELVFDVKSVFANIQNGSELDEFRFTTEMDVSGFSIHFLKRKKTIKSALSLRNCDKSLENSTFLVN